MNHLADALKMITDYEQKLKHKHKKISQINVDLIDFLMLVLELLLIVDDCFESIS